MTITDTKMNTNKQRRRHPNKTIQSYRKIKLNHKINVANKGRITSNKIKTNKKGFPRTNENSNHDGKLNLKFNIVNTSKGRRHTKNKHCHYLTTK